MEEGPPMEAQLVHRPVHLLPEHHDDLGLVPLLFPSWRAPLPEALEEEECDVEQKPLSPPLKRRHALSPW